MRTYVCVCMCMCGLDEEGRPSEHGFYCSMGWGLGLNNNEICELRMAWVTLFPDCGYSVSNCLLLLPQ